MKEFFLRKKHIKFLTMLLASSQANGFTNLSSTTSVPLSFEVSAETTISGMFTPSPGLTSSNMSNGVSLGTLTLMASGKHDSFLLSAYDKDEHIYFEKSGAPNNKESKILAHLIPEPVGFLPNNRDDTVPNSQKKGWLFYPSSSDTLTAQVVFISGKAIVPGVYSTTIEALVATR